MHTTLFVSLELCGMGFSEASGMSVRVIVARGSRGQPDTGSRMVRT